MTCMLQPVSPRSPPSFPHDSADSGGDGVDKVAISQEEQDVDLKLALPSEPIVGIEKVILDHQGPGAITPRALPTPPSMTPAQWAVHNLTHLPYHPGCPIRAATRRPNSAHVSTHEHLWVVPFLVANY